MIGFLKIGLLLLVTVVIHRFNVLWQGMQFDRIVFNHTPGPCRTVPDIDTGSEDIQKLSNGKAFITSGMKNHMDLNDATFSGRPGKIYLFDFNRPNDPVKELQIEGAVDIVNCAPHGIGVWEDKSGSVTVFVVVHRVSGDGIEKFRYIPETDSLRHIATISNGNYMWIMNDVVPVSEDSFYFSNYQYSTWRVERLLGLRWGGVVFFNGRHFQVVAGNMHGVNGVNSSPDGKYIYVAHDDVAISIFKRNGDDSLTLIRDITLGTSPDNLDVDAVTGDIWAGCHPIMHKLLSHLKQPTSPTPSQVLRLQMKDGEVRHVSEVYMDDGAILKGSTVAVRHQRAMLVGTVHDKLLFCDFKHLD